jgi:hypothetical protein
MRVIVHQAAAPLVLQANTIALSNVIPDADYSLGDKTISTTATDFTAPELITRAFADATYATQAGTAGVASVNGKSGVVTLNLNEINAPVADYALGAAKLSTTATSFGNAELVTKSYVDVRDNLLQG